MKGQTRKSQRRRGVGGSIKALFQSVLIHAGCLSPNDRDEIHTHGRRRRACPTGQSHCDTSNVYVNNTTTTNNNNNSNKDVQCNNSNEVGIKTHGRRHRCDTKDVFKDGIEEKQGNVGLNNKNSGAMFSLQNTTLQCDVCRNGETYWVSFTERSFHRGHRFKLYRGIINGKGPQSGEKCVVKVFLQRPGTQELCQAEADKSDKLRQLSRCFNLRTKNIQDRIRCPKTFYAPVDEVSKLKQLFFTGERKLRIGESVLFEPDIRIADDKPGKPRKVSRFMDEKGKQFGQNTHSVLDAFVHYTYHVSDGEFVACGFEGVHDEEGFSLTTPVIHSKGKKFGEGDLGETGIMSVFNNHICNQFCHDLTIPYIPTKSEETRSVIAKDDTKVEDDEEDVGESSSMISNFPQGPQDPQDASGSLYNDLCPGASAITSSKTSQCTESMTGYIEPSAPDINECLHDEFLMPPPAYTRERNEQLINWLREESSNSFLFLPPNGPILHPLPQTPGCILSVTNQTAVVAVEGNRIMGQPTDLNANFASSQHVFTVNPPNAADGQPLHRVPSTTETARNDDVIETHSLFSNESSCLSPSIRRHSEATTWGGDVAMETCSSSSCSSPFLSSRGRQGSTCSSRSMDNAFYHDHHRLFYQISVNDENRNPTHAPLSYLPTYEESEAHRHRCQAANTTLMSSTANTGFQCNQTTPSMRQMPCNQTTEADVPA